MRVHININIDTIHSHMATVMATESASGALGTPPSTASPSAHVSRNVSREPSDSIHNDNQYDGTHNIAPDGGGGGGGREIRANSLVDLHPLGPGQGQPAPGMRRDVLGGGVAAAVAAAASSNNDLNNMTNVSSAPPPQQPPPGGANNTNQPQQQPSSSSNSNNNSNQSPTSPSGSETISYSAERIIGNGSFGVVFQASVVETGETVAIKKVLQDKRFKNRELQIMRQLVKDGHSNIVALKHCFYSQVSSCVVVGWVCCVRVYIFLIIWT